MLIHDTTNMCSEGQACMHEVVPPASDTVEQP